MGGRNKFAYYSSPFRVQFTNFQVQNIQEYRDMMRTFRSSIDLIGNYSEVEPLPVNLIIWMSYIHYYNVADPLNTSYALIGTDSLQYMEFTGGPSVVFKSSFSQAMLSNHNGFCNPITTSYSEESSSYQFSIDVASFSEDVICSTMADKNLFSKTWGDRHNSYSFDFDVRSFSTALAVNMGVVDLSTLGWASDRPIYVGNDDNGISFKIQEYFDTRYSSMNPIVCIMDIFTSATRKNIFTDIIANDICFMEQGNSIFLPIFNHLGVSFDVPQPCDCKNEDTNEKNSQCNKFLLLTSLLYYPLPQSASTMTRQEKIRYQAFKLIKLRALYSDYADLMEDAYNASASTALSYLGYTDKLTTEWFNDTHAFCALSETSRCSLITVANFDEDHGIISKYQYDLSRGHCTNFFAILDDSKW